MRKGAKVILLKDHEMPYGPCQTLEYSVVELQIPHDEQSGEKSRRGNHPYRNVQPELVDILFSNI